MATFEKNLEKIRGEAIRGNDMRTAIADALIQAIDFDVSGDGTVIVYVTKISETIDDYLLDIHNE